MGILRKLGVALWVVAMVSALAMGLIGAADASTPSKAKKPSPSCVAALNAADEIHSKDEQFALALTTYFGAIKTAADLHGSGTVTETIAYLTDSNTALQQLVADTGIALEGRPAEKALYTTAATRCRAGR